ncbi:MAG: hypothetical protein HY074_15605 [Deltaproteobacteria bacterium]|nr:hypothetical protein [Deltaproteobacteria bacterium]
MARLEDAIGKLYQWQYGIRDPNDFTFQLFTLLQMASPSEFEKLATAYPDEAKAFKLWYQSSDPVEFFKNHGVWKGPRFKD